MFCIDRLFDGSLYLVFEDVYQGLGQAPGRLRSASCSCFAARSCASRGGAPSVTLLSAQTPAGRGVLGCQHRRAGAGERAGAQQAAAGRRAHARPGCASAAPTLDPYRTTHVLLGCTITKACTLTCVLVAAAAARAHCGAGSCLAQMLSLLCRPEKFPQRALTSPLPSCLRPGTGGNPELGEQAAQESYADLAEVVTGADMVRLSGWPKPCGLRFTSPCSDPQSSCSPE